MGRDDGVLAGNVAAVRSTFDAFRTACSRHGLRINMDKCTVAAPERWADEARRSFPEFAFHDELEILGAPCRSRGRGASARTLPKPPCPRRNAACSCWPTWVSITHPSGLPPSLAVIPAVLLLSGVVLYFPHPRTPLSLKTNVDKQKTAG